MEVPPEAGAFRVRDTGTDVDVGTSQDIEVYDYDGSPLPVSGADVGGDDVQHDRPNQKPDRPAHVSYIPA